VPPGGRAVRGPATYVLMRAAIVERPGRLVVRDVPEPDIGPYEARCEILYGAICTGTDRHVIDGSFPFPVDYPSILGHESIGRVVDVGPRVRHLRRGDIVTRVGSPPVGDVGVSWGGFAEVGIAHDHWAMEEDGVPRAEWEAHRVNQIVPSDVDPAEATMVITWRETLSFLTRMGVGPGARVLILGPGGNGIAFAAHAGCLGAATVAVVGSRARAYVAREAGATSVYDYRGEPYGRRLADEHTERFDFIIDAVGARGQLDRALPHLRHGGVVGIYGLDDWGALTIDPSRAPGTFTYYNGGYDEAEVHDTVIARLRSGALKARLWLDVDSPFCLEHIGDAVRSLQEGRTLKALVRLSGASRESGRSTHKE
jgi:2-desacetyl-2-hydroxyethyl bacteriochlorophyllide A dehydrogenase